MTAPRGTPDWREEMIALAREHVHREVQGDIEATLATLEDDCVYELHPAGVMFTGIDAARRAYENLVSQFKPISRGARLRQEWVTDEGLGMEYEITIAPPSGVPEVHSVIGILTFGTTGLSGERIYASDRFHRLAYGPAFDQAVALATSDVPAEVADSPTGRRPPA